MTKNGQPFVRSSVGFFSAGGERIPALQSREPKPLTEWPKLVQVAVRVMSKKKADGEVGVGDTVKRILGVAGEIYKVWFYAVFGSKCGCTNRQAWLNQQFPYTKK